MKASRCVSRLFSILLLGVSLAGCAPEKTADSDVAAGGDDLEQLRAQLAKFLPEIRPEDVRPSEAPGLYEIQHDSMFGYITADGKYLVSGDLIDVESGQSLTENRRRSGRIARLNALRADQSIVFAPEKGADAAHTVTVFTDIDCGYCRKMHREIGDYNAAGIAVRYLFYPRSGPGSESFRKAQAVWCSADRKDALTKAKQGAPIQGPSDCANPILADYQLGQELGLRGTPMMILPDGEVVNGYVPAEALSQRLENPPQG